MKSAAPACSGKLLLLQKHLQERFNKRAAVGAADKARQAVGRRFTPPLSHLHGAAHAAERGHACTSEHQPEATEAPGSPLSDAGAQTVFRAQDEWTLPSRRTPGSLLEDEEALGNGSPSVGKDGRVCSDLGAPVLKCLGGEGSARSLQGGKPPPAPPAGGSLLGEAAANQPWSKAGTRTANQDQGRKNLLRHAASPRKNPDPKHSDGANSSKTH